MQRRHLFLPLVLGACGGSAPPATVAPTLVSPPVAAPPAASAPAVSPTTPPAAAAPAPVEVLPLRASLGPLVMLFPEEIEAVRARVMARVGAAARKPLAFWPDERLRRLEALLAEGRLHEGGPVCARPPTIDRLLDLAAPGLARLHTDLYCDLGGACSLQAYVEGPGDGRELGIWTADVDADEPQAWLQAADRLAPADDLSGGGMGFGRGGPPPQVRAWLVHTLGDFGPGFASDKWQGPTRELAACHDASAAHVDDVDRWRLLALDDAGHPTRCSPRDDEDGARAGARDCVCAGLAHASFPAGKGPRRALVSVVDYGPPAHDLVRTPKGQFAVQAVARGVDDPGDQGLEGALGGREIARCMAARGKTTPATVEVTVEADPAGHVTRASARSDEPPLAACVERALPRVPLGCSSDGASHSARATLSLTTFGPLGPHKH